MRAARRMAFSSTVPRRTASASRLALKLNPDCGIYVLLVVDEFRACRRKQTRLKKHCCVAVVPLELAKQSDLSQRLGNRPSGRQHYAPAPSTRFVSGRYRRKIRLQSEALELRAE